MLRIMVQKHAHVREIIWETIKKSSDGSPKAQKKMEARVLTAGATQTHLYPGKRGRYQLHIYDWTGWDPAEDKEIGPKDPIPPKPWIVCWFSTLESKGNNRIQIKGKSILYVTHHALSRVAQRWGARTSEDLLTSVNVMWNGAIGHIEKRTAKDWCTTPPEGYRVETEKGLILILKQHESKDALVVATVY
jgi:hypothetical protein